MQDRHPLRIGCVKYLNARPLIRGWPGEVILDEPATLCAKLANGELDVALVSSFEFLRNPIYRIVDGVSISSDGPVYSVFVAHRREISEITEIELDPASQTSVNLLRCLLAELELTPRLIARTCPERQPNGSTSTTGEPRGRLLIGDQAIRFRQEHKEEFRYWDLGEQWQRLIKLPFVYALWLIRPEVVAAKSIANELRALCDENLAKIDKLISEETEFDPAFCARYYAEFLQFGFGAKKKEGLREFQSLCEKHRLLPMSAIEFNLA